MILVETSVWIDFFSSRPSRPGNELRRMIAGAEPIAVTGVIVAEILQGLTRNVPDIEAYLAMFDLLEPAGFATYRQAAAIFRLARSRGISLSTIDTLIAAVAVQHRATLFTADKDFARIVRLTNLQLHPLPSP